MVFTTLWRIWFYVCKNKWRPYARIVPCFLDETVTVDAGLFPKLSLRNIYKALQMNTHFFSFWSRILKASLHVNSFFSFPEYCTIPVQINKCEGETTYQSCLQANVLNTQKNPVLHWERYTFQGYTFFFLLFEHKFCSTYLKSLFSLPYIIASGVSFWTRMPKCHNKWSKCSFEDFWITIMQNDVQSTDDSSNI